MTYQFTRDGAAIETIHGNADDGNIGKGPTDGVVSNLDTLLKSGFYPYSSATAGSPTANQGSILHLSGPQTGRNQQIAIENGTGRMFFRYEASGAWQSWQEIYHTGNTGAIGFDNSVNGTQEQINFSTSEGLIRFNRPFTSGLVQQFNSSGTVCGSISITSGTTVSYNTSSDNALKEFLGKPTDDQIDAKFSAIYNTFQLFNWKNGSNSEAVWGWGAWDVVDAGLDFGTDRQGPRDAEIGSVYQEAEFDEDGKQTKPELRVQPAGVDQSKVVPYLVAKIEQLERRIKQLEG